MSLHLQKARPLAGALALAIGVTFAAPPPSTAAPRPIASAAEAKVAALPTSALAQAAPASTSTSDKSFIKTKKGAIAVVLLAGAIGYTAYSLSNDRVKSPAR